MPTVLSLFQTLLRKLTPAEVDQNFINLRDTADAARTVTDTVVVGGGNNSVPKCDANGNFGLGTVPPSWASGHKAINLSTYGSVSAQTNGSGAIAYCWNAYGTNSSGADTWAYRNSGDVAKQMILGTGGFNFRRAVLGTAGAPITWIDDLVIESAGNVIAGVDNTQTLGSASKRWGTVYAGTGTINTSDAREKTPVRSLTPAELAAGKDLSREIGVYQFLSAVVAKGASARFHIGMTVQRAIEIMVAHNLDPFAYGFICYDQWEDEFVEHPAIEANPEEGIEAQPAWREQVQFAGDRYSFRPDELLLFIARGFEARLTALEG